MVNDSGLIPVEFFVVVELDKQPEKTSGGIILPTQVADRDKLATQEGTLVAASPLAFDYADWPEGSRRPSVGDRVLFKKFEGALHERNGRDFRLLNDKSIVAIVADAETVKVRGEDRPISELMSSSIYRPTDGQGTFSDERPS